MQNSTLDPPFIDRVLLRMHVLQIGTRSAEATASVPFRIRRAGPTTPARRRDARRR